MPEAAEAGPSSRPVHLELSLCTFRELYEHLEHARSDRPRREIEQLVKERQSQLAACQSVPPPRTASAPRGKLYADAVVKLDGGLQVSIDADQKDLCLKISGIHSIDEFDALLNFKRFLQEGDTSHYFLKTTLAGRRQGGTSTLPEALVTEILDEFNVFYFEEQLYTIRCVASLLRIAEDSDHQYSDIADSFLSCIATPDFGHNCLRRFVDLTKRPLPAAIRDVPRYSPFWARHGLNQQVALLEVVFLLFYGRVTPSPSFAVTALRVLQETKCGQIQTNEAFFDHHSVYLLTVVHHCLVLIAVEALDLERALDGYVFPVGATSSNDEGRISRSYISNAEQLDEVLNELESASPDPSLSPIFLGWALILRKTEEALTDVIDRLGGRIAPQLQALSDALTPADGGEPVWTRLASAALIPSMAFFPTMRSVVHSPLISSERSLSPSFEVSIATSLAYRAVFKGLLLGISDVVRPEYISGQDAIIDLWEATFQDNHVSGSAGSNAVGISALCWQFWEVDAEQKTRRAVLDMAKRRWPVQFRPLVRLLKALTGVCAGVTPTHRATQACTEVLRQLYELPTLAHALPSTAGVVRPPWEVIESSDYAVLDYRCTRTIPVFGNRIAIQPGACGRMVSEAGQTPVVVVWELKQPISGWHILRDVLASFVKLLEGPASAASSGDKDDVFSQIRSQVTDFANLSPGETDNALVATEIVELFSAVLSGAPAQASTLLDHLESEFTDPLSADLSIRSETPSTQPSLAAIVQRILDQALSARDIPSRLVSAAYKLLGLLLPLRPTEVWLALRSSNLIIGSGGQVAVVSGAIPNPPSALLSYESSSGDFAGLRSLLSFHLDLLAEIQRSQYLVSPELSRIKTDTLLRALDWVCQSIWPEHQSWRFRVLGEKISIAALCTTLLATIIIDRNLRGSMAGAAQELSKAIDDLLVLHTSSLYIAPLISAIATGQAFVYDLQHSGNPSDAEHAHDLVASCLRLSTAVVLRRQELARSEVGRPRLCLLEHTLLNPSPIAIRVLSAGQRRNARVQVLSTIVDYTQQTFSASLCKEAGLLVTALCFSIEEHTGEGITDRTQSALGALGLDLRGIPRILANSHYDVESRRVIWTMAGAMVTTQPALARLLLGESSSGDAAGGKVESDQDSVLAVALDSVHIWRHLWDHDPALLGAVLHFLGAAWTRIEHLSAVRSKTDVKYWTAITSIITADTGPAPEQAVELEEIDGHFRTDSHMETKDFSHRLLCKARALHILGKDLQIPAVKVSAPKSASFASAIALATNTATLTASLSSAVKMECEPSLHTDVELKLATAFPEIPLSVLRHPAKAHGFDLSREYGDNYVFNTEAFQTRLEGFYNVSERLGALEEDAVVDDRVIQQAVLMLSRVNLDWSVIDAQTTYLRGWHQLLDVLSGVARWELKDDARQQKAMRDACLAAWITSAKTTADESRDGSVILGIHAARTGLLETLLEAAWGTDTSLASGKTPSQPQSGDLEVLRKVAEQVQKILSHRCFPLASSVRGSERPTFHRALFSITLLCARKARQIAPLAAAGQPRHAEVETHRVIHQAIDSFTSHAIKSTRLIVDAASLLVATRSSSVADLAAREEDLTLVCSLLELHIRPDVNLTPHLWLSQFQEVGLLPACVALLRRAPLRQNKSSKQLQSAVFMPALLSLLLALAAQQQSAEHTVLAGLMTSLSSNALSPMLEAGTVTAILSSDSASSAHTCWVAMLRLVVSIVENLDGDASAMWAAASIRFIETEVMGFVRLYGAQMGRALSFSPLAARGSVNTSPGEPLRFVEQDARITQPQLDELQATMRLFLVMASADGFAQGSGQEVMATFAERTSGILQQLVYLTERPHQLASLLLRGGGDGVGEGPQEEEQNETRVVEQMTSIATTAVAALWHQTRGEKILSRNSDGWMAAESISARGAVAGSSMGRALLRPTMRTAPGESASIGTLLDLAGHCIESLQKSTTTPSTSNPDLSSTQVALEQTLALAVTQLILNATFPVGSSDHQVVESGIQRDVAACIQSALSALRGVGNGGGEEGEAFLTHLASLCERI